MKEKESLDAFVAAVEDFAGQLPRSAGQSLALVYRQHRDVLSNALAELEQHRDRQGIESSADEMDHPPPTKRG